MDHDQRFKTLIQVFFAEFMELFFAQWAARLDLSQIEWLQQELFPDPPEGERHSVDLIAKVTGRPADSADSAEALPELLLVHIEIESPDRTTALKPRLPYYYHYLREKHQLPVLPIVIYLKVGLDGIGIDSYVERIGELEVTRFQYLYVGLPGSDAIEYLQGDNWLGVALSALMRIPNERVVWLGAEALRRLAGASLQGEQRYQLTNCVHAYLPLDEQQAQELEQLLQSEPYNEARTMKKTIFEEVREKARVEAHDEGNQEGQVEFLCEQLEWKFGSLSGVTARHLEQLSEKELRELGKKLLDADSLESLGLPT